MRRPVSPYLAAISLLALAAFAARAVSLDAQSLWRDEVDALRFATVPWPEMLATFTRPGWNGPLYFLLLRGWIALVGTSEYAMRFFSLAFGVLCVPLIYTLGCRLWRGGDASPACGGGFNQRLWRGGDASPACGGGFNRLWRGGNISPACGGGFNQRVGLLAALLVTASPYLTWYGQEVKMYTLVSALVLVAIYGLRRAIEGGGWRWWAVQVVATSLAFYAHILAALLIPVQLLLYLAWWPRSRGQWVGALISLASLVLPYLPLVVWQAPLILQARETGFDPYTLDEMAAILFNGWSLGILSWGRPWGTVLVGALAVWGLMSPLFLSPPRGDGLGGGRNRLALVGWLVTPLLTVWLISLRQPLFTDRYLIWAAPAFYLLVALGLASLQRFDTWGRWVVALLVSIILVFDGVNLWQQGTVPIKSDFRAAAAYIADDYTYNEPAAPQGVDEEYTFSCHLPLVMAAFDELIVFQIPYGKYTFDYYFPSDEYPWAGGLYTNHRAPDGSYLMSEQGAAYRMQEVTAGYDAVWLVATETTMWDERGLVQAWLEANARRVDEAHFTQVDVYRYVK
jgi:mannosyltransferase